MFNLPMKFVMIDGYRIPAKEAENYKKLKSRMEKEARKFFQSFCEIIKKEALPDLLGEGIVGYSSTGEQFARISLEPFELSAMQVEKKKKKLKEYILATNGYDEYAYMQLLKEYKNRNNKNSKKGPVRK